MLLGLQSRLPRTTTDALFVAPPAVSRKNVSFWRALCRKRQLQAWENADQLCGLPELMPEVPHPSESSLPCQTAHTAIFLSLPQHWHVPRKTVQRLLQDPIDLAHSQGPHQEHGPRLASLTSRQRVFPSGCFRDRSVWPRLMNTNAEQGTPNQAVAPIMRDKANMTERAIPSSVSKFRPAHSQTQLAASRTQIARATEPLYKVPPSHYLNGCTNNCWTLPRHRRNPALHSPHKKSTGGCSIA